MSNLFEEMAESVLDDEEKEIVKTEQAIPTQSKPSNLFMEMAEEEEPEAVATINRENIEKNPAVRNAAVRFVENRLGRKNVSEDDAVDEFVEHFRKFNINEMTAAGDFNYVSGLASDATGKTKLDQKRRDEAKQELADYRLLYTTFQDLPNFHGGKYETFLDYAEGILKAPSTYIGLALPGAGKAGGLAATTAAKAATQSVLSSAFKTLAPSNLIRVAAANPLKTAVAVEGSAAYLQDLAAQKTEIEADLRDDYDPLRAVTSVGASAIPAGVGVYGLKGLLRKGVERNTGDLLGDSEKAIIARNEKAEKAADKVLKENDIIAKDLKSVLSALEPESKVKGKKKTEEKIKKRALDEKQVEAGREKFADIQGDTTGVARTIDVEPEDLDVTPELVLAFDPSRNKRIFAAVTELIQKGAIKIDIKADEGKRVTEYISDAIRQYSNLKPDKAQKLFEDLADKYNLTGDDFANLFMADISDAARKLGQAGAASKIFERLSKVAGDDIFYLDTQTREFIQKATDDVLKGDHRTAFELLSLEERRKSKKSGQTLLEHLRRLDELRRSTMTSQIATTIRNTASGVSRVGIDVVTKAFDRGLSKAVHGLSGGKYGFSTGGFSAPNEDIFAIIMGIANKKETDAIQELFLQGFTKKSAQLFRAMQDVIDSGVPDSARTTKLRMLGKELNALNTASDDVFKRAAFVGNLKRGLNELQAKGIAKGAKFKDLNLRNIVRDGRFNEVFNTPQGKKIMEKAIDEALYFTYQRTPQNATAKAMINLAHSVPFLTSSLVPFPRFIANALRFTYEYSPIYLLDSAFLRFGAKNTDNYEEIAKSLVGTGGLIGAMAFRQSEYAGERWYEGRLPDGTTYDLRPFFPAAPYLWLADLATRYQASKDDPTAPPVIGESSFFTEGLQALSGTQFRAGFGIYALDSALEDFLGAKDSPEALQKIGTNMAANVINTYSIPLTLGQDLYNTFLSEDDERIVRESRSSHMLSLLINKSLARLPANYKIEKFLAESIGTIAPEIYESPTRAGVLRRVTPFTRQYMGILKQERKNWFEKEIDNLKISRRIIARKTGIPEADLLLNQHFGEYIEDYVVPMLKNSKDYEDMLPSEKRNQMVEVIGHYKGEIEDLVKRKAKLSKDELISRFGFNPMEALEFKNRDKFARERALMRYHELHGVPDDKTRGYNYDELIYYAKFYESQGDVPKN